MSKNRILILNLLLFSLTIASVIISSFSSPKVTELTLKNGKNDQARIFDQQIRISFSRPMDQKSVENTFSISPKLKGSFSWRNNTLYFTPTDTLRYGQTYTIDIQKAAHDVYNKQLSRDYTDKIKTRDAYFSYIGANNEVYLSDLNGNTTSLTSGKSVRTYQIRNGFLAYITNSKGDANELYLQDLSDNSVKQIWSDQKIYYLNVQLDRYANKLYAVTSSIDKNAKGKTIMVYDIATDHTDSIDLGEAFPFVARFWVLPDNGTFLITDETDDYFLRPASTDKKVLVGRMTDFGGSNLQVDKLVFSSIYSDVAPYPSVELFDGTPKRISQTSENGMLPNISYDGSLISYSFQKAGSDEQRLGVKVLDLNFNKVKFSFDDPQKSYERGKISPDNHYLAVESYPVGHHLVTMYDTFGFDSSEIPTLQILDFDTGKFLDTKIEGGNFSWIE